MRLIRLSFNACRIVYSPYSHSWCGNNWSAKVYIQLVFSCQVRCIYLPLFIAFIYIYMWILKPSLTVCADGYLVRRLIVHPLRE